MADRERERYEEQHRRRYAEWVRDTYGGPGCRAKIVGRAKYEQIVRAVRGELRRAADNSKFRFWVRAKGFRMGGPATGPAQDADGLYVVDTRNGGPAARESRHQQPRYKKVAVVDEFFDIIRRVHCSGGDVTARHSGQKRTHRMIMETYAFLPREAVTAFLMGCPQCSTNGAAAESRPCDARPPTPRSVSPSFACSTPVKRDAGTATAAAVAAAGPDNKENVSENGVRRTSAAGNKRKRTVPLKRGQVDSPRNCSSSDGTPKNSADGSGCSTLVLSSSSSLHLSSERSTASGSNGDARPLDLSWSPLVSSATRASSSAASPAEEFFYRRRRRVRPKRLNGSRSSAGRRGAGRGEDTSASESDDDDDGVARDVSDRDTAGTAEEDDGHGTDGEDGPGPAKLRRKAVDDVKMEVTTTGAKDGDRSSLVTGGLRDESDGASADESEETREKSAALHSPMNKRLNGSGHHPYHMHSRSIMNGLATSSSPSSLSKTLDTITTSGAAHHNFHRHWLDMANDSAANMMDVDGAADDGSMAAAAAAAAAALLFSPPSSVGGGGGISPGGPLSALHPNTHLAAHHHALSPLAPLALPHSAASVGLTSAHHHHHIQQQLQQYAAAAVAAATAAAAAAAAASTANDSAASPPPALPLALPPMAHHYGQGCGQGAGGSSTKRRSAGGAGLTVQQQLYRRSGTPTSSAASSPSPRLLNSKNDADTTTGSAGLHENGSFSASGPPTTTTTVLWPPLGLLTAAHQQHHHSLSSPPKFQQLFGSSVNSLSAAGSQILSSLPPPPPISSPSALSYSRPVACKDTNGGAAAVTTTNGSVTGNDVGTGTAAGHATNADEDDAAMDEEEDEEDEEDEEEEEEEDLDDDELEEGEEDGGDDEEEGYKTADGGRAQARRLRRQQVRRLRRLRREGGGGNAANNANDCADSGASTNYHQQWQQPSTTTSTALSQQQNQQSIGSSSQQHVDPERLKAFNMFVRLFVDENLDRQVPISRQPKDKVQAIIDSCGRQFPELSDRSRKRIRTYLKSCRRNKRNTPQSGGAVSSSPPPSTNPWPANGSSTDSTVQPQRPTPAHLTSAQAETILAVACQRESDNARRMRLGLEPVAQPYPYSGATSAAAGASNAFQQPAGASLSSQQNGTGAAATLHASSTSSDEDAGGFDKTTSAAVGADAVRHNGDGEGADNHADGRDPRREGGVSATGGDATMTDANGSATEESNVANVNCGGASVTSSSPNNCESAGPTDLSVNKSAAATVTATSPSSSIGGSGAAYAPGFRGLSSLMASTTTTTNSSAAAATVNQHHHHHHHQRRGGSGGGSSTATGMLQLFPTMATASPVPSTASTLQGQTAAQQPAGAGSKLLNKADVVTVRQLIAGYRESAAFLLRSADELEHLLLLRG